MNELKANTADGSLEKHVPVVKTVDDVLHIKIGSTEHPMHPEHYIAMRFIEYENRVDRLNLKPGQKPKITYVLN